jgi:hypothetical protein
MEAEVVESRYKTTAGEDTADRRFIGVAKC